MHRLSGKCFDFVISQIFHDWVFTNQIIDLNSFVMSHALNELVVGPPLVSVQVIHVPCVLVKVEIDMLLSPGCLLLDILFPVVSAPHGPKFDFIISFTVSSQKLSSLAFNFTC